MIVPAGQVIEVPVIPIIPNIKDVGFLLPARVQPGQIKVVGVVRATQIG